jgi:mannose-1-phosphate guanylyltransferase
MSKSKNLHAIILASGEDHNLKSLIEALGDKAVPRQYAFIAGQGSLLQQAVARCASLVPPDRMIVVVSSARENLARAQLRAWRGIDIIARPTEPGGGLDLLLPLGRLISRAPNASVLVTPADYYVPYPERLMASVGAGLSALEDAALVLVGVAGGHRRTGQGWILPGSPLDGGILSVAGLVKDASPTQAAQLAAVGALWNISTGVGRAEYLWHLAASQLPMHAEAVARLWAGQHASASAVSTACLDMPAVELNSALLRNAKDLAVVPVHGSGWTDWSSTEQVIDSLADRSELERLLSRIWERQQTCGRTELRRPPLRVAPLGARNATAA